VPQTQFNTLDFLFLAVYLGITLWIGFAVGRKEKATVSDYFRAGNRLPWYAIGFSILAAGISSEQFVGEVGYAYKLGLPVANWEWMVFPALSLMLWIFVPLYVRTRITTMPEYLQLRYGPRARTLYACLIIASYVFANFALVFYTGGFAVEKLWGINKLYAVWALAAVTGAYTIYGGLASVTWTDVFQCVLLMGGGLYVFFSGMGQLGWDFSQVLGAGDRAHLMNHSCPDVPWTALVILGFSTMTWYYANDQFINQRCLCAKNEWHAKMGILVACGLQLILPLAVTLPGMIYYTLNPKLEDSNAAYPMMVMQVVPAGLRGLVVAAVLGAVMSTISGLVNSTATMATLDIFARWPGKSWNEKQLVRFGQWSGGIALLIGALFAPVVMSWENIFRYCQDIWSPMAAPAVVVFLGGALWQGGKERGALVCLWLSILSVPFTFIRQILADHGVYFLHANLADALIFSGALFLISIAALVEFSLEGIRRHAAATAAAWVALVLVLTLYGNSSYLFAALVAVALPGERLMARSALLPVVRVAIWSALIFELAVVKPEAIAVAVGGSVLTAAVILGFRAALPAPGRWDRSMLRLPAGEEVPWYASVWLWWAIAGACFAAVYIYFW
jgi:SSS family solute:Na+ symporter